MPTDTNTTKHAEMAIVILVRKPAGGRPGRARARTCGFAAGMDGTDEVSGVQQDGPQTGFTCGRDPDAPCV